MKPSVFVAWDLKEYNEKEHKDIMQVVPKHEYDDLERSKEIVVANIRENFEDYKKISEKHIRAFEELVAGLESEIEVLKAKLGKAESLYEKRVIEKINTNKKLLSDIKIELLDDAMESYKAEISSITIDSIKRGE